MMPGTNPPRWWVEQMKRRQWDDLMEQARKKAKWSGKRARVEAVLDGRGRWHYVVMWL